MTKQNIYTDLIVAGLWAITGILVISYDVVSRAAYIACWIMLMVYILYTIILKAYINAFTENEEDETDDGE